MPTDRTERLVDSAITLGEAADRLRIHRNTAYRMVRQHRFPVRTFPVGGRIRVDGPALDRLIGGAA